MEREEKENFTEDSILFPISIATACGDFAANPIIKNTTHFRNTLR